MYAWLHPARCIPAERMYVYAGSSSVSSQQFLELLGGWLPCYSPQCVLSCSQSHSCVFTTPWTVACQAPLSMEFSRQEYCSGLPFPSPGDLLDPGITPMTLLFPALAGRFFTTVPLGNPTVLSKFLKQNLNTLCTFKLRLTGFSTYTGPDSHHPSHQVHSLARWRRLSDFKSKLYIQWHPHISTYCWWRHTQKPKKEWQF